ncbi:carboxymuconolactone decarboxylase family protein [Nocardioides albidus]|uniref:Carboxymuconolactone decarboxylase family protein n=1 Tax=Nocardioides albidus TaxID=1517589 RepID=A0A5C4W5I0_9ACTN|nr:carboxymuconolactone decarboxylase family protein [Nocardioides albidus]TNM43312.1 carboxymuconolactone decarboxylase family protein [Nocardioides albidus]
MSRPAGQPRIAPGGWREVGPLVAVFARAAGRVQGTEPPAVFLTLGRHRRLFWGWLHFAGRLMPGGRLSRRESELVILRVASRRRSAYELAQHRRLARRAGLTGEEIDGIETGGVTGESLTARERLLLRAADELLGTHDLSDPLWAELGERFDDRERIEIVMLVEHYAMLATTLQVLRVQPDKPR